MEDNQSPQQEGQESLPASETEPNVYEPQPRTPFQDPPLPPEKKSRLPLLLTMLLLFVIAAAAAGAYFMMQDKDTVPVENSQTTEVETEETVEEEETDSTYQSTLYSDLSFTVPEGWEVTEPEDYAESFFDEGSAHGLIAVTNDDVTLKLDLVTVGVTGFAGYTCYNYEDLSAVGDVYRFTDSEGQLVYADGLSETDAEWAEVIADEGNNTSFEDPDPNYCVVFPYIGTYSSTLNQADYPEQPYGFNDQEKVIVWLSATIEGTPTEEQQAEADAIIESLSKPDLGV